MAKGVWDLSKLYKNNDDFLSDFELAKKCLKIVILIILDLHIL